MFHLDEHLLLLILEITVGLAAGGGVLTFLQECELFVPYWPDYQNIVTVLYAYLLKLIITECFSPKFDVLVADLSKYSGILH